MLFIRAALVKQRALLGRSIREGTVKNSRKGLSTKSGRKAVGTPPVPDGKLGASLRKSDILAARQARKAEAARVPRGGAGAARSEGRAGGAKWALGAIAAASIGAIGIALKYEGDEIRAQLHDTIIDHATIWFLNRIAELVKPWTEPSSDKLLPDWPLPNLPPDMPCPPLLVLDLEGTLLGTVFTRKNGWRSAKRPGLDDFLKEMFQLYEIAVFTDSQGSYMEDWINKMDPNGFVTWRLNRDATKFTDGKHVKDLSKLNRPMNKIVIIDDNPDCFSLQPENGILVKKFSVDDGSDPHADTVLPDLAHFLRMLATQDASDFRDVLRPYIGKDSSVLVADFQSKLNAIRAKEMEERSRGLGGFVRQMSPANVITSASGRSGVMSSKDIVGEAPETLPESVLAGAVNMGSVPVADEKRGGLWKTFIEGESERREQLQRKNEVFQRVIQQREERERAKREEQEAKRRAKS